MKPKVVWLKPTKGNVSIDRMLIAENLRKEGFDVEIFECSWFAIFRVFIKLLKEDFDVIIGTTHLGLAVGGIIKLLKDKPFIADFVDEYDVLFVDLDGLKKIFGYAVVFLQKFSLKVADAVIVIPKRKYEEFERRNTRVFKTNLCINFRKFLQVDADLIKEAVSLLSKAGVSFEKPRIVYVGGFGRVYNLELLIRAMKFLPDCQLIMIGGGELEDRLKSLKKSLNLDNVIFVGYVPNNLIPGILKLCDVGVTLAEVPRQLKIYEYLASGLKVVVPKSVLDSEDFEFSEYCIGTELNERKISESIRKALGLKIKRDKELMKKLSNYDCRSVAKVYNRVLEVVAG